MSTMTVLFTRTASIKGKKVTVEQIKGKGKQEIDYTVNGLNMKANDFWALKPKFVQ